MQRLADVERRAAAVAGDDRRHAHPDEVLGARMIGEIVGVGVDVDEAGRDDQAGRVDRPDARGARDRSRSATMRPSLIATSARRPRRAGAVDHLSAERSAGRSGDCLACAAGARRRAATSSTTSWCDASGLIAFGRIKAGAWSTAPADAPARGRRSCSAHRQPDDHHDDHAERVVPEEGDAAGRRVQRERRPRWRCRRAARRTRRGRSLRRKTSASTKTPSSEP